MNKSSSLLLHLHLHLLHFLIMNKSSYFKKKRKKKSILSKSLQKKEKMKKKEIFKKGLGTRGIGLVLLRQLSKKKSSLNSFSGTESSDPLPCSPVVKH